MDLLEPVQEQYPELRAVRRGLLAVLRRVGRRRWPTTRRCSTWIAALPQLKQQPNLVFAAARWHGVPAPGPYAGLRARAAR